MTVVSKTQVGGFSGPQVCGLVGITYRQLDYWARTGLLQPSLASAKGSGSRRVYSYSDVLELKVIKQLLDAGVSLQSARRAVECLRDDLGSDVASANLVLTGRARSWRARTGRWSTCSPVDRASSTSFRWPGSSSRSTRTSSASTPRRRRPALAAPRGGGGPGCRGVSATELPLGRRAASSGGCAGRSGSFRASVRAHLRPTARPLRGALGVRAGRVPSRVGRAAAPRRRPSGRISICPARPLH